MIETVQLSKAIREVNILEKVIDWIAPKDLEAYNQELKVIEQIELENKLMNNQQERRLAI